MNKTIFTARTLLVVLLMMLIIPFVGSQKASALKLDDINITYDSTNGIKHGDNSAWNQYGDQDSAWTTIFDKYKGVIMGVSGIATLTMVVLFILNFMKLGQAAGNPQARSQALTGLLWTGLAAAGAGGVTVFVGVFSSILTK